MIGLQICYTYNILRTFSLIVWSIFVSIFSCIDIFDFFVEKIGYISDIYQWYISMIYIMPTLITAPLLFFSSTLRIMFSPYILNFVGETSHPCLVPCPIWNLSANCTHDVRSQIQWLGVTWTVTSTAVIFSKKVWYIMWRANC